MCRRSSRSQLDSLIAEWQEESEREAGAQQEAAERERQALETSRGLLTAVNGFAGQMERFGDMMADMVAVLRYGPYRREPPRQ